MSHKILSHILDKEPHFWRRKPIHYGSIFYLNIRLKILFNEHFYEQVFEQFNIASDLYYVRS